MLNKCEQIVMAGLLFVSCFMLAMVHYTFSWDALPESQKPIVLMFGAIGFFILFALSIFYCMFFSCKYFSEKSKKERQEYRERMENQFNVGACISTKCWIDADDYRRLASGSRK